MHFSESVKEETKRLNENTVVYLPIKEVGTKNSIWLY